MSRGCIQQIFPCPSVPWCFYFLGALPAGDFLGVFEGFLLSFQGLRFPEVRDILGIFEGFLVFFASTKAPKKDRVWKCFPGQLKN